MELKAGHLSNRSWVGDYTVTFLSDLVSWLLGLSASWRKRALFASASFLRASQSIVVMNRLCMLIHSLLACEYCKRAAVKRLSLGRANDTHLVKNVP